MDIILRPLSLSDTYNIVKWRNQPSVRKNLYTQTELKREQHIQYFENYIKTGKCSQFVIVANDENNCKDVGTIFIKNIDAINKNGEYGIFIGEESARGKGYAKQATKQILEFGFDKLQLHRIYLTVMADNKAAIKVYEDSGFIREGIMREEYLRENKYIDIIIMAMLREEWEQIKNENTYANNIG